MMLALCNSLVSPNAAAINNTMIYLQKYMGGTDAAALHNLKASLKRGEDGAAVFVGDSTYRDAAALPYQFATALANEYPTHRVILEQAASNMQTVTTTVVQAGPSGERYIEFDADATAGVWMSPIMQRLSLDGKTGFRVEVGFSLPAGSLNGSGWPSTTAEMTGFGSAGNRSIFYMTSAGILTVQGQGAAAGFANITASAAIPAMVADTRVDFRVDFTATNGANSLATFYRSTDGGETWAMVGTADRTGTAIVLTHPATSYYLGSRLGAPSVASLRFYRCQWYSTTTTPVPVIPERIDEWFPVVGYTPPVTTIGGSPTIYITQAAQDGATLAANGFFTGSGAGDLATEAYRCMRDHLPSFVSINTSHNDGDIRSVDWETFMDAHVTVLNNWFLRDPVILHTTQNPENATAGSEIMRQHRQRQKDILIYASKKGRGCTDIYQAWLDANNSAYDQVDNVHPSGAGYVFWGQVFYRLFQAS